MDKFQPSPESLTPAQRAGRQASFAAAVLRELAESLQREGGEDGLPPWLVSLVADLATKSALIRAYLYRRKKG